MVLVRLQMLFQSLLCQPLGLGQLAGRHAASQRFAVPGCLLSVRAGRKAQDGEAEPLMGLHVVQRHAELAVVHDAERSLGHGKAPLSRAAIPEGTPGIFRSLAAIGVMLNDVGQ